MGAKRTENIVVVACLTLLVSVGPALAIPSRMGDMDEDGQATVLDMVDIQNHILGIEPYTYFQGLFADADFSSLIDSNDVNIVRDAALGLSPLPEVPDVDNDGIPDFIGPGDHDFDLLSNRDELARGTDPYDPDSDGDGFLDGREVQLGTSPTDPGSYPFVPVYSPLVSFANASIVSDSPTSPRGAASELVSYNNTVIAGPPTNLAHSAIVSYMNATVPDGATGTTSGAASLLVSFFNAAVESPGPGGTNVGFSSTLVSYLNAHVEKPATGSDVANSPIVSYLNAHIPTVPPNGVQQATSKPVSYLNAAIASIASGAPKYVQSELVSYLNALIGVEGPSSQYVASGLVSYSNGI